jgi:hypothetical protein
MQALARAGYRLPATGYRPPAIGYRLSITGTAYHIGAGCSVHGCTVRA